MEYTIIHSDLVDGEIKPQELLKQYSQKLESDIREYFKKEDFVDCGCPTNGETAIKGRFEKMGMNYCVSQTFGNIYISPRPSQEQLMKFYHQSSAREFWLKELWTETIGARKQKVIGPQLEWTKTFIRQYLNRERLLLAEYYPTQWGYFEGIRRSQPNWEYHLVQTMFSPALCDLPNIKESMFNHNHVENTFDVIYLFEALDRSENPQATLKWVEEHLKPGGLCFITCLLASGFETQILGQSSEVFMPPERINLFSYEGLLGLIEKTGQLQTLEFSTPGVLDIPNIIYQMEHNHAEVPPFMRYIVETRKDPNLFLALQDFLQMNKLSSFGRLVLRKE